MSSLKPLRVFTSIKEFAHRHKEGTEAEFAACQRVVDVINKESHKFQAWVVVKIRQTTKRSEYMMAVAPGTNERKMPQQNEPAKLRIAFVDGEFTRFWEARRIETPLAFLNIAGRCPDKLAWFQVTVHRAESHEGVRPLVDASTSPSSQNWRNPSVSNTKSSVISIANSSRTSLTDIQLCSDADTCESPLSTPQTSDGIGEIMLTGGNSVQIQFLLSASESTMNAELMALEQLGGRHINASERQLMAFRYFVLLRDPEFVVDLHMEIPHLKGAMAEASWPNSPLAERFGRLNPQQKEAYMRGFHRLNAGICILPGGPGAGKTHFNLFTIAMAQLRPLPRPVKVKGRFEPRYAKVLFIVDMNSPVDDVANRMVRLYNDLGMKKLIIRMKGWGSEVRSSGRLNAAEDAASADEMTVDFTNQFLRTANFMSLAHGHGTTGSCKAPSLDEAAWQRYDEFKATKYEELTSFLEEELWENSEILPLRFRRLVYNLYRDTLAAADFIATTPVAASNHFCGMFKPDLVYFDEAPHARELSNLIAIANFDPIAWIFCGDHRQTVPYVGSATAACPNIYREQMQISMMERADVAGVIKHELLMNHRAFGGLHQLASTLWYSGRMVSGNDDRAPSALLHTRKYLENFTTAQICTVPRLLVHLKNCGPEEPDGTSAWNPSHTKWVMERVRELIHDEKFRHADRAEPGTILIISPYKKAYNEYKNAVKTLPHWAQRRVETRTVDVVQGHEADFVFLDLVKEKSTRFLDDPNRLCVAVTRARLGEIIMMHPRMVESTAFIRNSRNLRGIYNLCKEAGQVTFVDPASKAVPTPVENCAPLSVDTMPATRIGEMAAEDAVNSGFNTDIASVKPIGMAYDPHAPQSSFSDDLIKKLQADFWALTTEDGRTTVVSSAADEKVSSTTAESVLQEVGETVITPMVTNAGSSVVQTDEKLQSTTTDSAPQEISNSKITPVASHVVPSHVCKNEEKPLCSVPEPTQQNLDEKFDTEPAAFLLAGARYTKNETLPFGTRVPKQSRFVPNTENVPRTAPLMYSSDGIKSSDIVSAAPKEVESSNCDVAPAATVLRSLGAFVARRACA